MDTSVDFREASERVAWALTPIEVDALNNSPNGKLAEFAALLKTAAKNTVFAVPVHDKADKSLQKKLEPWKQLAHDLKCDEGPSVWDIRSGFSVKWHATRCGPCKDDFRTVQNLAIPDTEAITKSCRVYWVPRIVPDSFGLNETEMLELLGKIRDKYGLPDHHATTLGSVSLVALLILMHFRQNGRWALDHGVWVRTQSTVKDPYTQGREKKYFEVPLKVGGIDKHGLRCVDSLGSGGENHVGCFVFGIEEE